MFSKKSQYFELTKFYGAKYRNEKFTEYSEYFKKNNYSEYFKKSDEIRPLIIQKSEAESTINNEYILINAPVKLFREFKTDFANHLDIDFFYNYKEPINEEIYTFIESNNLIIELESLAQFFIENNNNLDKFLNNYLKYNFVNLTKLIEFSLIFKETKSIVYIPTIDFGKEAALNIMFVLKDTLNEEQISKLINFQYFLSFFSNVIKGIEVDYLKQKAQICSAVAAIMARNLSHNIGSHILTYLKDRIRSVKSSWENHLLEFQEIDKNKIVRKELEKQEDYLRRLGSIYQKLTYESDKEFINRIQNLKYEVKIDAELYNQIIFRQETLDNVEAPFLLGLSRFIGYLQERQDFIATISTDYIPYNSTINFKEFIYDELNWDYKIQRHHNLVPHNAENILLDNIARSEKLDRHRIHIWYKNFNGIEDKVVIEGKEQEHEGLKELRTINIDIPGSVIGRQAMFSIIENIVRNSAKHGLKHGKEKTSFVLTADSIKNLRAKGLPENIIEKITFAERKSKKYGLLNLPFISEKTFKNGIIKSLGEEVYKQFGHLLIECAEQPLILKFNIEKNPLQGEEADDYWKMTITDNNWNGNKAIEKLHKGLKDKYVDETGKLLESNKGIKEMRISAAWLRNEFVYETDEENTKLTNMPFLDIDRVMLDDSGNIRFDEKSVPILEEGKESCLRYTFYIRKAKKVAMILSKPEEFKFFDSNNNEIFININNEWEILSREDYEKKKNKNYKIVLVDETLEDFEEIKKFAVCRVMQIDVKESKKLFAKCFKNIDNQSINDINEKIDKLFDFFYKKWIRNHFNRWDKFITRNYKFGHFPWTAIMDDKLLDKKDDILDKNAAILIEPSLVRVKKATILFRRHELGDLERFNDYLSKLNNNSINCRFLEETSGHNSTFRITHNEKLNKNWSLKIVESTLTNVLIIDERICERYANDSALFHKTRYHFKNIHIMNLIQDSEYFQLQDITGDSLGIISKENEKLVVNINDLSQDSFYQNVYSKQKLNYDFVLIHQGLLDKIHELFSIDIDTIHKTLSGFIRAKYHNMVHSGRSKPDKIPKDTIFVLFSSLEKVLEDCKFSLTELLYSARLDKK